MTNQQSGAQQQQPQPQILTIPQQFLQNQQIINTTNATAAPGFNIMQPMQTVTIDGQEAVFIPATNAAASNQTLISQNGQIIRTSPNVVPIRQAQIPQLIQFPVQQTIPVQIPITTSNGQTIYQTLHFPLQAFQTAAATNNNAAQTQQLIPQQIANFITPTSAVVSKYVSC